MPPSPVFYEIVPCRLRDNTGADGYPGL